MLIGAYYYAWYKNNWLSQTNRISDPPLLGEYDNVYYGKVAVRHMRMMKKAGIDFAAISWSSKADYGHILDAAESSDMKVTALYESLDNATGENLTLIEKDFPSVISDIRSISDDFNEDCWLRIDGKPVVIIYVSRNYQKPRQIFPAIREAIGDVFLVGDEVFWEDLDEDRIKHFDALTTYNWYQNGKMTGTTECEICDSFLDNIRSRVRTHQFKLDKTGVPYWPVTMPGYNDNVVRPQSLNIPIPRLDGYFFEATIKDAMANKPRVCMITSMNEWMEDTQIEPSASYGKQYLDIVHKLRRP
jgi:hypothetical protein